MLRRHHQAAASKGKVVNGNVPPGLMGMKYYAAAVVVIVKASRAQLLFEQ